MINGKRTRTIRPSRGLRQGDPLSPYLFILIVDVLSRMIEGHVAQGKIAGLRPRRGCPEIHHMLFAYGSLFFFKGFGESATNLRHTLDLYCRDSGQLVNYSKASIYFQSSTGDDTKREITIYSGSNKNQTWISILAFLWYGGGQRKRH